jgi:methyl-accepting chemotaxis protein
LPRITGCRRFADAIACRDGQSGEIELTKVTIPMKLNQIKLGPRLVIAFLALVLLGVVNAAVGWWRLETAHQDFADLQEGQSRAAHALEWEGLTRLNVNRALVIARSNAGQEVLEYFDPQIKETSAQISKLQKKLEEQSNQNEGMALFAELGQRRGAYLKTRERMFELMKRKDPNLMQALDLELVPAATAYLDQIAKLRGYQQSMADRQVQEKNQSIEDAQTSMLFMSAVAMVLGLVGSWVVTRSVTAPLRHASAVTARIAEGELSRSVTADGRDEVAQLLAGLAQMQQALSVVVREVRDTTDSIRTASGEVADGSMDLSGRTETAAANLQQTASAIEQISASAQQNAASAQGANALAVNARDAAQRGGQVVAQVVQTMSQISTRSNRIADITGVIDGIAFQTNILALNAAVEAARAGEHGRGFAVVASEVRILASRSASAAQEIKSLIGANVDAVETGSALVAQTGSQMSEICGSVDRVADMIEQIALASSEQSQSVSQVNQAVTQLDEMTQQNAALVEESAAAASSLRDQAARLVEVVSIFHIADRGVNRRPEVAEQC